MSRQGSGLASGFGAAGGSGLARRRSAGGGAGGGGNYFARNGRGGGEYRRNESAAGHGAAGCGGHRADGLPFRGGRHAIAEPDPDGQATGSVGIARAGNYSAAR